jgi:tetratricopeptide (TPR) repeat protein
MRLLLFGVVLVASAVGTLADTNAPASLSPVSTTNSPAKAHTSKELPAGAGALMAEATLDLRQQKFKEAEEKYNEVLRQDENNVYVLAHLASAQYEAGEMDACEKTVLRAISLDPDDANSQYLLGVIRYRQTRLDDALAALNRSVKSNPTNSGAQYYLGSVLFEKGQRPAAETAFRKALQLDPEYADAHYNLAYVYATETPPSLELARWHYKHAIDLGHVKNDAMEKLLAPPK